MKKVFLILLAMVLAISMTVVGCPSGEQQEEEEEPEVIQWKGVTGWPVGTEIRAQVHIGIDLIEQETDGMLQISMEGPESWPGGTQIEAVADGVYDYLYITSCYHLGYGPELLFSNWMGGYTDTIYDTGAFDVLHDVYLDRFGTAKLIGLGGVEGLAHAFLFFREPLETLGDIAGRTIRAAPVWHPSITAWGAEPLWMSDAEAVDSLMMGAIDGAMTTTSNIHTLGYTEVAPYLVMTPVTQTQFLIFVNLDSWNALSADLQAAVMRAIPKAEQACAQHQRDVLVTFPSIWDALGQEYVIFSEEDAAEFLRLSDEAYLALLEGEVSPALFQQMKGMIEASPPVEAPSELMT